MLKELRIKNFAIIDQLEMQFKPGLITFTGETGAGKSIIMDALDTLLGSRAETELIRSGVGTALIEATFQIPQIARARIHAILNREDLLEDSNFVVLGREIRREGRNVARVNGRTATLGLLREIGEHLVDIHGQSEHLSLLKVRNHLQLLDRYAYLGDAFSLYQTTYRQLIQVREELEKLRQNERQAAQRADMIEYQINEIEAANLTPGEESELEEERARLANAEKLTSLGQKALLLLDETDFDNPSISDQFGQVIEALNGLTQLDPSQSQLKEQALAAFESISEINHDLRIYLENIEFNPNRLDEVEERVDLINHLKRKYGDTIEEVLRHGEKVKSELDDITHAGERITELETQEAKLLDELGERALELAEKRHQAADKLQSALESELEDLRMSGARFQVDFQHQSDPQGIPLPNGERVAFGANGYQRVEFLIETNPGEGLKPLTKVASGGETSRLMLALKNVLARADHIPTLIFDEIDQGIGGRVGAIVGYKLWLLSHGHQVLCITHLPQLAAFGHQHYKVRKIVEGGRTITKAQPVEGEDRLRELAQMLGDVSDNTLTSAKQILHTVQQRTTAS